MIIAVITSVFLLKIPVRTPVRLRFVKHRHHVIARAVMISHRIHHRHIFSESFVHQPDDGFIRTFCCCPQIPAAH